MDITNALIIFNSALTLLNSSSNVPGREVGVPLICVSFVFFSFILIFKIVIEISLRCKWKIFSGHF
jgi:hypothetical protein